MFSTSVKRVNVTAVVALLVLLALTVAGTLSLAAQLRAMRSDTGESVEMLRLRHATVTIFDIQRMLGAADRLVADRAVAAAGGADTGPRAIEDFARALDQVYVRAEVLGQSVAGIQTRAAAKLTRALDLLIRRADTVLNQGVPDPEQFRTELNAHNRMISRAILQFYDEQKTRQVRSIEAREGLLTRMTRATVGFLLACAAISAVTLYLWRAEVIGSLRRRAAEAEARYLAAHDSMTGLANRARFTTTVDRLIAMSDDVTVILIDLDGFKAVNDLHGHAAGDALLVAVARRLGRAFARVPACVARLGGDEFAVALDSAPAEALIGHDCHEALAAIGEPVPWQNVTLMPRASIGFACGPRVADEGPLTTAAILRAADLALFQSKEQGRNTVRAYDTALARRVAERERMEAEMPAGLARGEFFVVFQPQVQVDDERVHGFEALVRWRRDGEIVPPTLFVPLAETTGFVCELDRWVLAQAVAEAAAWPAFSPVPPTVSVNLSAANLATAEIVDEVRRVLAAHDFAPERLTLEITESVLIEDWDQTHAVLDGLAALGVSLALDDFGTGYSSLSYLRHLNVDEVKIDRSFLTDIETSDQTRFMLDGLTDIVYSLSMRLVVEGVETPGQLALLRSFGCKIVQGYLYGAPMPAAEARDYIRRAERDGIAVAAGGPERLIA